MSGEKFIGWLCVVYIFFLKDGEGELNAKRNAEIVKIRRSILSEINLILQIS